MMKIILDTDIGPDCDDAAAIALANILENKGYCQILGIGHCTSNPYCAGTIDAICRYYGHDDIQIGTSKRLHFLCSDDCMKYNKLITSTYPNRFRTEQPENVISLYRRLLASQNDSSVDFISIGPLTNLSDLLDSTCDAYYNGDGWELVRRKVRKLTIMGGIYPCDNSLKISISHSFECPYDQIAEFNILCDIRAAQNVASRWPSQKDYLGFESGLVKIGKCFKTEKNKENPVRMAYSLFSEDGLRYSWDPLTVECALVPNCSDFKFSDKGKVQFDNHGRTFWKRSSSGNDRYIQLAQDKDLVANNLERFF